MSKHRKPGSKDCKSLPLKSTLEPVKENKDLHEDGNNDILDKIHNPTESKFHIENCESEVPSLGEVLSSLLCTIL